MTSEIYLGLMSGTSLDGIDAVAVSFESGLTLLGSHSLPMPDTVRADILGLTLPGDNEIDRMGQLDRILGQLFGHCANSLIEAHSLDRRRIRAIGSHGQTIRHRPGMGLSFTLQIGDPNTIAEETGLTVVADFRRRDIAAGGQGAPLVPAFHEALFRTPSSDRVILNLGGIANITLLPAKQHQPVRGYDTGPANMLMDGWIQRHRKLDFDRDGAWAMTGSPHPPLLERLLAHPFLALPAPKSTGREDFNLSWLDRVLASFSVLAPADVQATLAELTAASVANAIRSEQMDHGELWVCGGGACNRHLLGRLQAHLPGMRIGTTEALGLPPSRVEAAAFAWLACRTVKGLHGNAPDVTGARGLRILGGIYPP